MANRNFSEIIQKMVVQQGRLLKSLPLEERLYAQSYPITERASLVLGPRGVGKTTHLLSHLKHEPDKRLYISLDHPMMATVPLWELIEAVHDEGYECLCLDEIHFHKDWSLALKTAYDSFPDLQLIASDSSSLILRVGMGDLSRRFPVRRLPFLSLREYVYLKHKTKLPLIKFPKKVTDLEKTAEMAKAVIRELNKHDLSINRVFKEYLKEGYRPIFLEGRYEDKILAILEKTIFTDIPFFLREVKDSHLQLMRAVLSYLASSKIPTLNIDTISREWATGKDKVYQLLHVLEHVDLIRIVRHKTDKKASGKGAKILFADPTMYGVLGGELGNVREAFVVSMFSGLGMPIHAAKDDSRFDFEVAGIKLEIGGKQKKSKDADIILRDDAETIHRNIWPLWILGFLY